MDNLIGDIFIDAIDDLSSDDGYVSKVTEVTFSGEILREGGIIETTFRFTCNGATRSITVGSTSLIPREARLELLSLILEWELFIDNDEKEK